MKLRLISFLVIIVILFSSVAFAAPAITLNNTAVQGQNAVRQSFHVTNDGGGALNYAITSDQTWAVPGTTFGGTSVADENNLIVINYNTTALLVGAHVAVITVTDITASNSPQTVQINMAVTARPTLGVTQ